MRIIKIAQPLYTEEVAKTTTDPKILNDILRRGKDDNVSYSAAQNPNCPPEALAEVLKRGKDDDVSQSAAQNPNCPPEVLAEVLRRNKDDFVSYYAAKNPNCPPEAKIKWMRATGKIEREDPSKGHIVEYDTKEEVVDEDLEKLKKLISKNNNWYKIAQDDTQKQLKGYFKCRIHSNTYDVLWTGMENNLRIINHNIPHETFINHSNRIIELAQKEASVAHKKVLEHQKST